MGLFTLSARLASDDRMEQSLGGSLNRRRRRRQRRQRRSTRASKYWFPHFNFARRRGLRGLLWLASVFFVFGSENRKKNKSDNERGHDATVMILRAYLFALPQQQTWGRQPFGQQFEWFFFFLVGSNAQARNLGKLSRWFRNV